MLFSIFWKQSRNSDKSSSKIRIQIMYSSRQIANLSEKWKLIQFLINSFRSTLLATKKSTKFAEIRRAERCRSMQTFGDLVKSFLASYLVCSMYLQKSASIQPRTSLSNFGSESSITSIHSLLLHAAKSTVVRCVKAHQDPFWRFWTTHGSAWKDRIGRKFRRGIWSWLKTRELRASFRRAPFSDPRLLFLSPLHLAHEIALERPHPQP